jgi:1-aminocyclopropane-1-carboxylate deaminase/D-cysteine desulfhydrase-like pyridoxal-dependent ACC family enzyme
MISSGFDRLEALPRERLGITPTPITFAPGLASMLGVRELWIKRDELIGFGFGGNKVRGLELLLADARRQGADTLVTGAGPQSNHVRATAAAAAFAGMEALSIYWGERPRAIQGNLKLTHRLGAKVRFTGSPDRTQVDTAINAAVHELRGAGRQPYAIPRGGACALGVLGHVLAAGEVLEQCIALERVPSTIVLAVGSGGTLAGWLLGTAMLGASWRVVGVSVSRPVDEIRKRVVELAAEAAAMLNLPPQVQASDVVVHDEFIGGGYGIPSPAGDISITRAARLQGLFLDPTYTGKAFAGLRALTRQGDIEDRGPLMFIHTGGEPALFVDTQTGLTE